MKDFRVLNSNDIGMKYQFLILNTLFNKENYPDLVGQIVNEPPPHANVRMVKEDTIPMSGIFEFTSAKSSATSVDFVRRCIREGFEQKEILEGLQEYYHESPEQSNETFKEAIVKMTGIGKNVDKLLQNKKASSNWYKTSQTRDFRDVNVRRLNGILLDFQSLSKDALVEMEKWLANGEDNISFEEAQNRLSYYLDRMGLK